MEQIRQQCSWDEMSRLSKVDKNHVIHNLLEECPSSRFLVVSAMEFLEVGPDWLILLSCNKQFFSETNWKKTEIVNTNNLHLVR